MTLQILSVPQQAFLNLATAVSGQPENEAHLVAIGADLGFWKCQIEAVPPAPMVPAMNVWFHRSTAQAYGDFPAFPLRITAGAGVTPAFPDPFHLVTSSHFARYVATPGIPDVFVLKSASILVPRNQDTFPDAVFCRLDECEMSVRLEHHLQNAGLEYIWQVVAMTKTEFLQYMKIHSKRFGPHVLREIEFIIKSLNLSFGMQFPEGFPRGFKR